MIAKDLLLKRLSTIKLLYKIGLDQSKQSEATSYFSILSFHDSIEMFLKLATEHKGINSEKFGFLSYWDAIEGLTLKESMRSLNSRRVNLKHKGLLPAKIEIETSRINAIEFFEQNTPIVFGFKFEEVSLFDLITFKEAKKLLIESQKFLDENVMNDCVAKATVAFHELLAEYKKSKIGLNYKTHFDFIENVPFDTFNFLVEVDSVMDKKIEKVVKSVNKNFEKIDNALEVISLGLDYRKYTKFKILTPFARQTGDGKYHLQIYGTKNWTKENCQFLIDFVLECGLKLQEFDFDFETLDLTRPSIKIKMS